MKTRLCIADDGTFWPFLRWPQFAAKPTEEKARTTIVVPVCGLADHGLGLPLDAEETLGLSLLKEASRAVSADLDLLVLPPLRFVAGPDEPCAFAVAPPVAHALLAETCTSIQSAGFTRILFFNTSPSNEDIVDAAGRDLRISHGLQMFCINLSGLDLDFAAGADPDTRTATRTLCAYLLQSGAEACTPPTYPVVDSPLQDFLPSTPSACEALPFEEANTKGPALLQEKSAHLAALLREVSARPTLPDGGTIPSKTSWP